MLCRACFAEHMGHDEAADLTIAASADAFLHHTHALASSIAGELVDPHLTTFTRGGTAYRRT